MVGIEGRFTEVPALCLLQTEMHAREEDTSDKRDFVIDEQYDVPPLLLELLKSITGELIFPRRLWGDTKTGARGLSSEAYVESGNASIGSKLDGDIHPILLTNETHMLHNCL